MGYRSQVLCKDGKYNVNKLAAIPDPDAPHGTLRVDLEAKEPTSCGPTFAEQMGTANGKSSKLGGGERKDSSRKFDCLTDSLSLSVRCECP